MFRDVLALMLPCFCFLVHAAVCPISAGAYGSCVIAGRAESQDGSVTAGSVSVQDSASEAGHSTAPQSYMGEHLNSRHRHSARPGTAYSEAGSTDAASVQTVRGSEATLGDVAEALKADSQEVLF